jgi:phage-related protein
VAQDGYIYVWIDQATNRHRLDDGVNFYVLPNPQGLWSTEADYIENVIPGRPGAKLRGVKIKPREVELAMMVVGDSYQSMTSALGQLAAWTDPNLGDGLLEVTGMDGTVKVLRGRAQLQAGEGGPNWRKLVLGMHAGDDPYWQRAEPLERLFTLSTGSPWFNNGGAFLPLNLATDAIQTTIQETNPGSVEAYPIWTVTGPGTDPVLTCSGKTLTLSYTIASGHSVTIDTRPDYSTVKLDDGTNLISNLTANSQLWTLPPGHVGVAVTMTGASSASGVRLRYTPRWRSL